MSLSRELAESIHKELCPPDSHCRLCYEAWEVVEMAPTLKAERCPSDIGIACLRLKRDQHDRTVADVVCNLDFNKDGDLLSVEFMSWPKEVKQQASL